MLEELESFAAVKNRHPDGRERFRSRTGMFLGENASALEWSSQKEQSHVEIGVQQPS